VSYRPNGMRDLLHRLNFVYKKPKRIPAQSDKLAQQAFIKKYCKIQRELGEGDRIYFVDATHLHYQTVTGYGWIKKGQAVKLRNTATQPCVNIIERLWLFSKKKVLYNRTYENVEEFYDTCQRFFKKIPAYEAELSTLLTDNFQVISA